MRVTRQRATATAKNLHQLEDDDVVFIKEVEAEASPPPLHSEMEIQRKKLRQRWELASILNFLNVFEPVIKSNLKISAEEIESALIEPNESLAQLHICLLKGILPPSKVQHVSDAWVSILSKKLSVWWPWVAEGDFPLTAGKGEEMNRYKELDPTIRLFILKALCEIRADQDDVVFYINDNIKSGGEVSAFQKEKLGGDGNGTLYWSDGNAVIGHRFYKEVQVFDFKPKAKVKGNKLGITSHWETLATNFEEFREVLNAFSSSKVKLEVAVGKAVKADIMPALEKLQKKKERELKQQQRKERLLNVSRTLAITRSSRRLRPVSYKFEEYDRAIEEAIDVAQNKKTTEQLRCEVKHDVRGRKDQILSIDVSNSGHSRESQSTESDTDSEKHQFTYLGLNANDGSEDVGVDVDKEVINLFEGNNNVDQKNSLNPVFRNLDGWIVHESNASRGCKRHGGNTNMKIPEIVSLTTKNRLRQRPVVNTALESGIVPDSEDEKSPKDMNKRVRICRNASQAAATDIDASGSSKNWDWK
ncbi:DDT domain-containing protein DDR4 [Coffea arabica]|uniref:DDT domain-containing protein DDR4 n=1 Tax=Coffea arabica TaxID=13443 RepID=A0A6P6TRC6_COFAR|nr:DDT domain-containing protein DDR4-like [Coffea arabica]